MQKRRIVAAAVVAFAAAMLTTSAGAGSGGAKKTDLSTDLAVATYLTSIGVDPAAVLIQRGLKNYAGPRCPGAGWNCTTATKVVQVAQPGGENRFECGDAALFGADPLAASLAGYAPTGACFAIQDGQLGTNTIDVRHERSNENNETLTCVPDSTQMTEGGQNHFNCHLVIHVKGSQLVQTATEIAGINQEAIGGGNHSNIHLEISLTSTVKAPAGDQKQDGHQSAVVNQTATMGAQNHSVVNETQYLRARITDAEESNQYLNTGDLPQDFDDCVPGSVVPEPNSCFNVNQSSDGTGQQESQASLLNDLDARTTATSGSQNLGDLDTGLDGTVPQPTNGGTDKGHEPYVERQVAFAGGPGVDQNLTGPMSCCALQTGSAPNSVVNADLKSVQHAVIPKQGVEPDALVLSGDITLSMPNPNATEVTFLSGKIETNGSGFLDLTGVQDGGTESVDCRIPEDGPACARVLAMVNGQQFTCDEDEIIVPNPEPPPPFLCEEIFED
jgi:hypothetical protein